MKNLIDDIKRHTPRPISGYRYLKTQKIYIPFTKITIECLTRKVSILNLFFESILKLIDISVNDINEIARILGVPYSVVKEAVVDMVSVNYIYASENILGITSKGANALKTRQRIDIQKTYLKDIIVDMITGSVYDGDSVKVSNTHKRDVFLEGVIQIDNSFLDSHFREINEVYQLQQKNKSVFSSGAITNELYKTIGISYSELHYVENEVYMYKSESSDELMFVFSTDNNDRYKNEFYNQLKDECRPCQEYFFETNRDLVKKIQNKPTMFEPTAISHMENINKLLFDDNTTEEVKIGAFTQRRYALYDREYLSYLYSSRASRYSNIFICSDHMNGLLSHTFCSQLNVLANKIPVYIIYDKNERNIEGTLNYFFKNSSAYLYLIPSENIEEKLICYDSELVMYLQESVVTAFNRSVVYMQLICDFNKKNVSETVANLLNKYGLDRFIKPNPNTQNGSRNHSRKKKQ